MGKESFKRWISSRAVAAVSQGLSRSQAASGIFYIKRIPKYHSRFLFGGNSQTIHNLALLNFILTLF